MSLRVFLSHCHYIIVTIICYTVDFKLISGTVNILKPADPVDSWDNVLPHCHFIIVTIICYTVDFKLISGVGVEGNALTLSPR